MSLLNGVKAELAQIEVALRENLQADLPIVAEVAGHILFSGGKRLRPLLMVLCARACGYSGPDDIRYSTIFEYLHVASLLHDDLVDSAALRRGKPVAHSIWGNATAVLVGDYLLARALDTGLSTGSMAVLQVIADITQEMSQGEIDQLLRKGNSELTETEYREVIRRKTAVLIQGACRVGVLIAGSPPEQEQRLSEYGLHLGMAFQMADDLLDYTANTQTLGKEIGADLKEGKMTLPLIHAMRQADPNHRQWMRELILSADASPAAFQQLLKLMAEYGSLEYAHQQAQIHVRTAQAALSAFPAANTIIQLLHDLADYTLMRNS